MIEREVFEVTMKLKGPSDFELFCREHGIWFSPKQLQIADAIIDGKSLFHFGRLSGKKTVQRMLKEYIHSESYVKHFKKTHFLGVTAKKEKFVYCPVGNICSWSEGDFDNRYCAWCKNYFKKK